MTSPAPIFESAPPTDDEDKRRYGYSRDKRSDCVLKCEQAAFS